MGADAMPRHEVVKRMWAIIKERNLYDPKNKQFAICDEQLMKVFGNYRQLFLTFWGADMCVRNNRRIISISSSVSSFYFLYIFCL
jgi:chromatin remodeling complex protein RSC6